MVRFVPFLTLLLSTIIRAQVGPSESQALRYFFQHTGGPRWFNQTGWGLLAEGLSACPGDGAYSLLHGVTCSGGSVQLVHLESNNLGGTFPPNNQFLDGMHGLTGLYLAGNPNLGGALPTIHARFPLSELDLSNCGFNGTLTNQTFTGRTTNMNLQGNQLNGEIPQEIPMISPLLQFLYLGNNTVIYGEVPETFCTLHELNVFDVMLSKITKIPSCWGPNHTMLTVLNLFSNNIRGYIPDSWCAMRSLKVLQVQENYHLGGLLPGCIGNWTQLDTLAVENTEVGGEIPPAVFSFRQLQTLVLSLSKFWGEIPDKFDQLPHLLVVTLNGNPQNHFLPQYNGSLPSTLFRHSGIQTLSIQYTHIKGPIPSLTAMQSLYKVDFANNRHMVSPFPLELLTEVWNKPITDPLKMRELHLENSRFTSQLPRNFNPDLVYNISRLPNAITLQNNRWEGYIPDVTKQWVPPASWPLLLQFCTRLLYPITDKSFLYMTNTYPGNKFNIGALYENKFSMAGGEVVRIPGNNLFDLPGMLRCGFCVPKDAFFYDCVNETSAKNTSRVFAMTDISFDANASTFECLTPKVNTNTTIVVGIFYVGPSSAATNDTGPITVHYVSRQFIQIAFYEPKPFLSHLTPSSGRIEGCTTITAKGYGFLNGPSPTLALNIPPLYHARKKFTLPASCTDQAEDCSYIRSAEEAMDEYLYSVASRSAEQNPARIARAFSPVADVSSSSSTDDVRSTQGSHDPRLNEGGPTMFLDGGKIVDDNTVTFVLPFSNPVNFSVITYLTNYSIGQQLVAMYYPNGKAHAEEEHSIYNPFATYEFQHTCRTPLIPCRVGYLDPENCPVQAMCRCHSTGICNRTTGGCECAPGFRGDGCEKCVRNYFGEYCTPCSCDHGSCSWGMDSSGTCDCEKAWMGSKCDVSVIAVGVGCGLGLVAIIVIVVCFKTREVFGKKEGKGNKKKEKKKAGSRKGKKGKPGAGAMNAELLQNEKAEPRTAYEAI